MPRAAFSVCRPNASSGIWLKPCPSSGPTMILEAFFSSYPEQSEHSAPASTVV